MNIRNKNISKRRNSILYICGFIIYSVLIYVTLNFYRDELFDYSLKLTSKINKNQSVRDYIPIFDGIADFLGTYRIYVIISLLIYNSANIYKTFIFVISLCLCYLVGGTLKLIYHYPLMYYSYEQIDPSDKFIPIVCSGTWGLPSTNSITTTCAYLTLWKIIFDCGRLRYKSFTKIVSLLVLIFLIFLINVNRFLAAIHSIDQIFFGMLIGFQIFLLIFYVIKVDLNNGKDLVRLLLFKTVYYLLINVIIGVGVILLYIFVKANSKVWQEYDEKMDKSVCSTVHPNLRFDNEALVLICLFFTNIGCYLGIKFEFIFIFNLNELNWRQYNFNKECTEDDSLLSRLSISKETQWNHTTFFFGLIRLLIITIIHLILALPFLLISFKTDFIVVIVVKIMIPLNISVFFMFFVEKLVLNKLSLTNDSIFKLLNESL